MKILKELILNGEYINNDIPEFSNIKFKLDYDQDNQAFKITITPIDQTKSPSIEHRKRAFAKLAEIFNEETTGFISKEGNSLKIEMASLTINSHGFGWLKNNQELKETINLLVQIVSILKNTLQKISNDLIAFINNKTPYSSRKISLSNLIEYHFSDKFSHAYQMRLIKVYYQRLNELLQSNFAYKPDENTGISYTENPAVLSITQLAMERLYKIFNTPNPFLANAETSLKELQTAHAKNQAKLDNARALLGETQVIAQSLFHPSMSQATPSTPPSSHSASAHTTVVAPSAAIKLASAVSIEAISSRPNRNHTMDLELLFATGELLIEDSGYKYIASYYYDLESNQINIEIKNENQSNLAKDELSPRSANCQRLAEIIYHDIIHKFALPINAEIHLDKSKNKITLKNQAVGKIFSANDSEIQSNLLKTIHLLTNSDSIECNKLLIEITSNKNKYFRSMLVGDNYEITCEYGNTQFKANPGISERMSSDLSNLLCKGFTQMVADKCPELNSKLNMRSPGKKASSNCYAFVVNKKACDDVLIKTYLSHSPETSITCVPTGVTLENAKNQLPILIAPFKDRYLNSANLTDFKKRIVDALQFVLQMSVAEKDLESICQFYEFLKTPEIFKYINAHKNSIYDTIFFKNNTNTWQEIMKLLKNEAFEILKSKTSDLIDADDKIALLRNYRKRPIFTDHRFNKFSNSLHSTQTVKEIDKLIASYRSPQNKVK